MAYSAASVAGERALSEYAQRRKVRRATRTMSCWKRIRLPLLHRRGLHRSYPSPQPPGSSARCGLSCRTYSTPFRRRHRPSTLLRLLLRYRSSCQPPASSPWTGNSGFIIGKLRRKINGTNNVSNLSTAIAGLLRLFPRRAGRGAVARQMALLAA